MCYHEKIQVIDPDEQLLFTVIYCSKCDSYFDGIGYPLELKPKELIKNG